MSMHASTASSDAATSAPAVAVRRAVAVVDTGLAAYGETPSARRDLSSDVVAVTDLRRPDSAVATLLRLDVDVALPQPEGRAAAFQEQETFAATGGLDVTLDVPAPAAGVTPLCLYQHKEWWMRPTWVRTLADVPPRTQLVLYRDMSGRWVALVAVAGDDVRADFAGVSDDAASAGRASLRLSVSSNRVGRTSMRDVVAYAATGDDPYAVIDACVHAAARRLGVRTRDERPFPKALAGIGWCTWDSLGRDVNESAIIAKMDEFRAKDVPISWVLIDDGWSDTDRERETLRGFDADRERFPHGLAHTVALLKRDYGVNAVGVWQAFQGYWAGLEPDGEAAAALRGASSDGVNGTDAARGNATDATATVRTANGCLIPAASEPGATRFWDTWDAALAAAGVDFVKVDSQSSTAVMTRGAESHGEATWGRHCALDAVIGHRFDGALINCMGMAPEDYWHRPTSPITRSSDDYLPHNPESLAEHIIQNAYCSLLMGGLYHCDWDMFWTEHPHARVHALLRAMSGGPVYCSDALGRTDASVLRALLDPATGELRRPDVPARPIPSSLLSDPTTSDHALGVEARYGDERVVAFVGLRPGAPQTGVVDDRDGDDAGQVASCEVAYGDIHVRRMPWRSDATPSGLNRA
ncbi:Sip1-related alpha-galactosidase [Bifidobacterium saguinibicoloris]|uniref:Sip1-related alpha-galactosidase n=1 Tax=Bifidobacterium saguinibicoloris TaxID=2834433 RepID=UPI001F21D5F9|nr:Sip1-related alpha-galactosidase [Bifidobacterium saguinibicoloris]